MRRITLLLILFLVVSFGHLKATSIDSIDNSLIENEQLPVKKSSVTGGVFLILLSLGVGFSIKRGYDIRTKSIGNRD